MEFKWHKQSQLQWNSMSSNWNHNSEEMWERGSRKTILPFFKKYVERDSGIILDAGCGDGYGTWKLARDGYSMVGIDFSDEMIKIAEERKASDLDLEFHQGDITALPYDEATFASIISINCLEWVESPLKGLQELYRVLNQNGFLCIGVLGPTAAPRQHSYKRLYDENVICNTMMPWEFARLAEENGFTIIDGQGVYKRGIEDKFIYSLPEELKQAMTFLWLFILKKR